MGLLPPGQYYPYGDFWIFQKCGSTREGQKALIDGYEPHIDWSFFGLGRIDKMAFYSLLEAGKVTHRGTVPIRKRPKTRDRTIAIAL
jgi:hypothetical protein